MGDIVLVDGSNELNVEMWPTVPTPGKGLIWGFVTDSLTGAAVPNVKITCDGIVRYTASEGQYEIRDLDIRQYQLVFSKEGYETVTRYATPDTQLNITLPPIVPTNPELVYAYPAEAQIASGGTGHINYKVGIPDIAPSPQQALIFLFGLEGIYWWTPYACASVDFREGAKAGYYEGSAGYYAKYLYATPYKFANIPRGTYRLLSTCQLFMDVGEYAWKVVKTYWKNLDTGEKIIVV